MSGWDDSRPDAEAIQADRTGELLRRELPAWLLTTLAADEVDVTDAEQLVGGHSNETWRIACRWRSRGETGDLAFVMRWGQPDGVQAPYDIPGQFRLLTALSRTTIPVPTPLWLETNGAVVGAPFLTMEIAAGITPNRYLQLDDPIRDAKRRAHAEMLARIHGTDWKRFGIDQLLPVPTADNCAGVAIDSIRSRAVQRGLAGEPWVIDGLAWLSERTPAHSEIGLLHGDPNLTNYRFEGEEIVAVLDWDAAILSDPLWDVGAVSGAMWMYFADEPVAFQERERERFLSLYQERSRRPLDRLRFWETLFVLRAALLTHHPALSSRMSEIFRRKLGELTRD